MKWKLGYPLETNPWYQFSSSEKIAVTSYEFSVTGNFCTYKHVGIYEI